MLCNVFSFLQDLSYCVNDLLEGGAQKEQKRGRKVLCFSKLIICNRFNIIFHSSYFYSPSYMYFFLEEHRKLWGDGLVCFCDGHKAMGGR